jgi:mRNA interferase RelE/StbE
VAYRVLLTRAAGRDLDGLPRQAFEAIDERILALASEPRPASSRKMEGYPNYYRLRWTDYRAVYEIDDKMSAVVVIAVGHRSDIYRKLHRRSG